MVQLWHCAAGTMKEQTCLSSTLANCMGHVLPTLQGSDGLFWSGPCCVYLLLAIKPLYA